MTSLSQTQVDQLKQALPKILEQEPIAKHTSLKVGGPARLYLVASTVDECMQAVRLAQANEVPFYVFGGGSNLLAADEGFEGLMIQMADMHLSIGEDGLIECGPGALTVLVARKVTEAGFGGFEWAVGVPGTIGGAAYGNAGCYGGEMKDNVFEVDALRLSDQQLVTYPVSACEYAYRESLFKHSPHVILRVRLKLSRSPDVEASKARINDIITKRKDSQPLGAATAGSTFKNFEYTDESQLDILKRAVGEIRPEFLAKKIIPAGWLIEQAGMMGQEIGNVQVSTKHGNFFITKGQARAQDIVGLISRVKMKVRDEFGIELQEEVQYVGF